LKKKEKVIFNKFNNLIDEVNYIFAHTNYHSYKCRLRYKCCCIKFARQITGKYSVKTVREISREHIKRYVDFLYSKNLKSSTIRLEINAIFYMLNTIKEKQLEFKNVRAGDFLCLKVV